MSTPDADWLRAVIQQTMREMVPELVDLLAPEIERRIDASLAVSLDLGVAAPTGNQHQVIAGRAAEGNHDQARGAKPTDSAVR